jgi:putative nucleotidyltransferase with HDIG domain
MSHRPALTGREFYAGLIEALTDIMGSANSYLHAHARRVAHLARQLAVAMDRPDDEVARLVFAGILCDVGMIGLAEEAWSTPTPRLPDDMLRRVHRHPVRSEEALDAIPHLHGVAPLVRHHHEWYDGSGYPDGLRGRGIPIGAQILRLADTVAALGEARPMRDALGSAQIALVVEEYRGLEFGPAVADVFLRLLVEGEIADYDPAVFQRWLYQAADRLIPAEVSAISADHLLEMLSSIIDAKDPYTAGHSRRVAILSVAVADRLGLDAEMRAAVWAAGYLHDIGKLSVPVRLLTKPARLDDEERATVHAHPARGAEILAGISALRHLIPAVQHHHERWDGCGYPDGLQAEQIPMSARILTVCDAYDAMTSARSYRPSRDHQDAMDEVASSAGCHFCPQVAGAFLTLPEPFFQAVRAPRPRSTEFFPATTRAPAARGHRRFG